MPFHVFSFAIISASIWAWHWEFWALYLMALKSVGCKSATTVLAINQPF
jgi:hypothetical protein